VVLQANVRSLEGFVLLQRDLTLFKWRGGWSVDGCDGFPGVALFEQVWASPHLPPEWGLGDIVSEAKRSGRGERGLFSCYNLTSKKGEVMETLATTRMSSKGQVVIPESIRKQLNLQEGAQFLVVGEGDVVVLKVVTLPDMSQFDELIKQARQQAKEAGLTEEDVTSAVAKARGKK